MYSLFALHSHHFVLFVFLLRDENEKMNNTPPQPITFVLLGFCYATRMRKLTILYHSPSASYGARYYIPGFFYSYLA